MQFRYFQYLQDCLHSGDFGSVRIGMGREEVRERLGEPNFTGGTSRKQQTPLIWKYGEIELHFAKSGELVTIFWEDGQGDWIYVSDRGNQIYNAEAQTGA